MAKSSKKSREGEAHEGQSTPPSMESTNGFATAEPAQPAVARKAATKSTGRPKSAGTNRGAMPRKASAKRKTRAKTGQQPTPTGETAAPDEEVRMRAYLISEWRRKNGVPGDSAHDWLEARRQLKEESSKRGD